MSKGLTMIGGAVLNSNKQLVGIVSLGDLAVHTPDTRLTGVVLEYVSEPAEPSRKASVRAFR